MSADAIKKAALFHFANKGYEGTSLSIIAGEVGIKKQSIYAHFSNKDELFLTIMNEALLSEKSYIKDYFTKSNNSISLELKLYQFLKEYGNRYELQADTKFLLRTGFLPPAHLHQQVNTSIYNYYDEMEEILIEFFENKQHSLSAPVKDAVIAFIGLSDSVLVDLLYSGNERFQRRLQACWNIYWRGVTAKEE